MSANKEPIFVLRPRTKGSIMSSAAVVSSNPGNTTNMTEIFHCTCADHSRIDSIEVVNAAASVESSTGMIVKLFHLESGATAPTILREVVLPATTRGAATIGAAANFVFPGGLLLETGQKLFTSQSVHADANDDLAVVVRGGDFSLV